MLLLSLDRPCQTTTRCADSRKHSSRLYRHHRAMGWSPGRLHPLKYIPPSLSLSLRRTDRRLTERSWRRNISGFSDETRSAQPSSLPPRSSTSNLPHITLTHITFNITPIHISPLTLSPFLPYKWGKPTRNSAVQQTGWLSRHCHFKGSTSEMPGKRFGNPHREGRNGRNSKLTTLRAFPCENRRKSPDGAARFPSLDDKSETDFLN